MIKKLIDKILYKLGYISMNSRLSVNIETSQYKIVRICTGKKINRMEIENIHSECLYPEECIKDEIVRKLGEAVYPYTLITSTDCDITGMRDIRYEVLIAHNNQPN